jgi:hypothetical protein
MKLYSILFVFLIIASITAVFGESKSVKSHLSYDIKPKLLWEEKDVEAIGDVVTNYTLKESKNITMNFSYLDQDISNEIKVKSVDELVSQLVKGKSFVYSMIGASNHQVVEKKLEKENNIPVLRIKTQYEINNETYNLIEKYYIVPNKVLLTSFRWTTKNESEKNYLNAFKDYENVKVKAE